MGRPLFYFPYNVNEWLTRLVGVYVFLFCVFPIIFRDYYAMRWVCVAFAVDFGLRTLAGARASLVGHVAESTMVIGQRIGQLIGRPLFARNLIVGMPKQFAAFCGTFMSTLGAALLFVNHRGAHIAGGVVFCVLGVLAGIEGFLNICVACKMFSFWQTFIGVGLTPSSTQYSNDIYDESELQAHEFEDRVGYPAPEAHAYRPDGWRVPAIVTRHKKDPYYREHWHPVKHMSIVHFYAVLGVVGLAAAYKFKWQLHVAEREETHKAVYKTLAIVAATLFGVMSVLYGARVFLYPKKCRKDWDHPLRGASVTVVPIIVLLFAFILDALPHVSSGGWIALFWIGAVLQALHALSFLSRLVTYQYNRCWLLPPWLMPPVGLLVCAMLAPLLRPQSQFYRELGWLFFGPGFIMWLVLLAACIQRLMVGAKVPEPFRPSVSIFVACPAIACAAYSGLLTATSAAPLPTGALFAFDGLSRSLFYVAVFFAALCVALLTRYYFARDRFNVNWWVYAFCADTMCFAALVYRHGVPCRTTQVIEWIAFAVASAINALLGGITVVELLRGHLLLPEWPRPGPFAMMRSTHYALRHGAAQLEQLVGYASFSDAVNGGTEFSQTLAKVSKLFTSLDVTATEHSLHEDRILFPSILAVWPGAPALTTALDEHHGAMHTHAQSIATALATLQNASESAQNRAAALQVIRQTVKPFAESLATHIDHEEDDVAGCKLQKHLVTRMWEQTSAERWRLYVELLMNYSPLHQYRVAFLKALSTVLPERAELLGQMVYNCVDGNLWSRLTDDVPELVPHGLLGYRRYW